MAALITNLFTTKFAILKWFQMLCCIITVLFLIDGRMQWWPYTLVHPTFQSFVYDSFQFQGVHLCHHFGHFMLCHPPHPLFCHPIQQSGQNSPFQPGQHNSQGPNEINTIIYLQEFVFNVFALLISVGFAILLIVDYAKMMGGQFDHHRYQPPQNIGK